MRIGILVPLWKRSRLSRMVLTHLASIEVPGAEIVRLAVWSWEDPEHRALWVPGWRYVQAPNGPTPGAPAAAVSDKWNAGALALRGMNIDALMVFGSDDFTNAAYVAAVVRRLRAGADYVMPRTLYFLDAATGRAMYCRSGRVGAGRAVSRRVLDALGWRPWRSGVDVGIDGAMDKRLASIGLPAPDAPIEDIRAEGGFILDVKTEVNMWPYSRMEKGLPEREAVDAAALLREQVPRYANELLNW